MKTFNMIVAALMLGALVAGCGKKEETPDTTTPTTTETPSTQTPTTPDTPTTDAGKTTEATGDIVEVATAAGTFNTLAALLTEAGLVETLKGAGPFTVLAPTDEAFAKIPAAELDKLKADKELLKKVLLAHVVSGEAMAEAVKGMTEVTTEGGAKWPVKVDGDKVMIGTATVTAADVKAKNGVIHVIDTVLIPAP